MKLKSVVKNSRELLPEDVWATVLAKAEVADVLIKDMGESYGGESFWEIDRHVLLIVKHISGRWFATDVAEWAREDSQRVRRSPTFDTPEECVQWLTMMEATQ